MAQTSDEASSTDTSSTTSHVESALEDTLEPWLDWFRRATHTAEDLAKKHFVQDWVDESHKRKWRLAGHMARRTDERWATCLLNWVPSTGRRKVGHPVKRWGDELAVFHRVVFDNTFWQTSAQCRTSWSLLEEDFASVSWG